MHTVIQSVFINREKNTLEQAKRYLNFYRFINDDITRGKIYYICRQMNEKILYRNGYQIKMNLQNKNRQIYYIIAYK